MKISDPIADMLTRIRNAGMIQQPEVAMPSSKMKVAIAGVLRDTGYIRDFRVEGESKPTLTLELKYMGDRRHRQPVIEGIERVSKPSARTYVGSQEMPRSLGGLGVVILSTPQGVMSDRQAKAANVGGEVLCRVW
jgi:small subunit ribosomal protein S8